MVMTWANGSQAGQGNDPGSGWTVEPKGITDELDVGSIDQKRAQLWIISGSWPEQLNEWSCHSEMGVT